MRDFAVALLAAGAARLAVAEHLIVGAERGDEEAVAWLRAAAREASAQAPPVAVELWRHAEALVAAGAARTQASAALRQAHGVAIRIGAQPLGREIELLAQRARLDLAPPDAGSRVAGSPDAG